VTQELRILLLTSFYLLAVAVNGYCYTG